MSKRIRSKKRKSKKRRSRRSRKARPGRAPIGIDFGCLPENAALSTLEFPTLLSNASIVGVAYGEAWSDALEVPVPSLTLVAERPEPLRQAFEIFSAWSASTDGDSVEITVILRTAGGYLLVISPEFERLMQRCLGFDRTESSFAFSLHWCMPINTTHHQLEQLRSYCEQPMAPFLFSGVARSRILTYPDPDVPQVSEIPGLKPLLKFEISFVDEADVRPDSIQGRLLKMESSTPAAVDEPGPPPAKRSVSSIGTERARMLATHFPVTLAGRGRSGPPGSRLYERKERRNYGIIVPEAA